MRPAAQNDGELIKIPKNAKGIKYFHIPEGQNLLGIRARAQAKDQRDLVLASIEVKRLINTYFSKLGLVFQDQSGAKHVSLRQLTAIPYHLLQVNYEEESNYLKKSAPIYLSLEKNVHLLNAENINALMSVDTYPYFPKPYYLNITSYDFDKHSLIIGAR